MEFKEADKDNLCFIVAIVWHKSEVGAYENRLKTSIYFKSRDGVSNPDEALGKAIKEQRNSLPDKHRFNMAMNDVSWTFQEPRKPDLSCLRFC